MNNEDRRGLLDVQEFDHPVIALTHNPDTTSSYTEKYRANVTLVGHTHGGQVRIPFLYKRAIPVEGDFDV